MIIGMDVGTTGCKAILFDYNGKELYQTYREYDLVFSQNGFIEQDSIKIINLIKDSIKEITSNTSGGVEAICFSVFGGSLTAVDSSGDLIQQTIAAFDPRGKEELEWLSSRISTEDYYNITGLSFNLGNSLIKILWIKNNLKTYKTKDLKFISFEEYIYLNFQIEPKISNSLASNLGVFDNNDKRWSGKLLELCDLDNNNFYEPVESGEILGEIPKRLRDELGLKKNTKIISGGFDQCCAALGAGAIKKGIVANGMGTVESFVSIFDRFTPYKDFVRSKMIQNCHVVKDKFILLSFVFSSGSILKWYRDMLGYEDALAANKAGINFYEYIINKIPDLPNRDTYLLPHFVGSGTPEMDQNSKGIIMGLSLKTSRSDIVRSILEGLAFEIRINMDIIEESGLLIDEIRATGGGSKSDKWLQLKADILGKTIYSMQTNEAGCTAALILSQLGLNMVDDIEEAITKILKKKKKFYPNKNERLRDIYEEKFNKYKKIYPAMKKIVLD